MGYISHSFKPVVWISELSNYKGIVRIFGGIFVLKPVLIARQITLNLINHKQGGIVRVGTELQKQLDGFSANLLP